jgi:hypothetical protein
MELDRMVTVQSRLWSFFVWSAKASLALTLIYSLLFLANSLGATFQVLVHGGMVQYTITNVILSAYADFIIWGIAAFLTLSCLVIALCKTTQKSRWHIFFTSIPLAFVILAVVEQFGSFWLFLASLTLFLLFLIFSEVYFGESSFSFLRGTIVSAVLFFLIVALVSFAGSFLSVLPADWFPLSELSWLRHGVLLDLSLSNVFYPLLPFVYVFFVLLGVFGAVIKFGFSGYSFEESRLHTYAFKVKQFFTVGLTNDVLPWRCRALSLALLFSVALSSLLIVCTVLPWINPSYKLVSVDAPLYYNWLHGMHAADFNNALVTAFAGDRSAFMIFVYLLSMVVPVLHLVQFLPLLMVPVFSVLSVLLVRRVHGGRDALIFTALLTPLSIQALGLIYSGYFAQMAAILLVYVYYLVFLKVQTCTSFVGVFASIGVSILILFTHPWTWFVFALSLITYVFVKLLSSFKAHNSLWGSFKVHGLLVFVTLLVSLLCDYVRQFLAPVSSASLVYETVQGSLAVPDPILLLNGMKATADSYLGGVFGSPLLVFLVVVGFLVVLADKSELSDLLVSWTFVASVSILLTSSEFAYHRFLFLMPLAAFSGLGLSCIIRFIVGLERFSECNRFWITVLVFSVVFLFLLTNALRFVTNINMP